MATYRNVHISFWQDPFVISLTPEEKYFYLYLMTNSKTTQCGIYELPKRIIEFETGYNRETVDKLLERFVQYRKIDYYEMTQEIIIYNWIKHNSMKSPKVKSCVMKELESIKYNEFKTLFFHLSKRYGYCIDSLSIDSGEEEEKEEEKEKEKEKEKIKEEEQEKRFTTADSYEPAIADVYTKVFGGIVMKGLISDYITELLNRGYNEAFIKEVMYEVGESSSNPNLKLFKSIAERWIKDGILTREQNKKTKAGGDNEKPQGIDQHGRGNAEDKPITGGQVGWLPSKYNTGVVVPLREVSG